ncbi:MAG TPA: TetR/AcrR family transcriptional regulator [Terriglobales bacterium]|nr:TetR/AcrR family transcriptional regulator [Terriglobales bacterium]
MATIAKNHRLGSRGQPEQTRAAILQAAMREFAQEGVAGARTDAIARAARVNKALLYYYFKDKEALYGAVVDQIFAGLSERVHVALNNDLPPREKYLAYVGAHFDYIASNPVLPRIAQREWMSAGRNASPHLRRIVQRYLRPIFIKVSEVLREGIAAGEFRRVDPFQFVPSTVAIVVSYFANAPLIAMMAPGDPLSPDRIAARRAAVFDFVSAALFQNANNSARKGAQP